MRKYIRYSLFAFLAGLASSSAEPPKYAITPGVQSLLHHISAKALRGNLSFLASDLLEGRGTPSRGLEIAAEFIASQFRRAGLEPAINGDYFQVADLVAPHPNNEGFNFEIHSGGKTLKLTTEDAAIEVTHPVDLKAARVVKLGADNKAVKPESLEGKVVIIRLPESRGFRDLLRSAHPAVVAIVGPDAKPDRQLPSLMDPAFPKAGRSQIFVDSQRADDFIAALPVGESDATADVHIAAPIQEGVQARNVIGLLPGSDPVLKNTYVVVSAHYDHLGMKPDGPGDRIYNGANDDGSGVVSMIEIANALADLPRRPARSIVFIACFGEEEGLIGSGYYVHHPVFPLAKTVADVNIEQVGRTDTGTGKNVSGLFVTGYDYSTLPKDIQEGGQLTGVKVYDPGPKFERFFNQSDNRDFAEAGIPAHSFGVAFLFPDYHAVGDEWQKIDYDNLAKITRALALGVMILGNDPIAPAWNANNPQARRYSGARK